MNEFQLTDCLCSEATRSPLYIQSKCSSLLLLGDYSSWCDASSTECWLCHTRALCQALCPTVLGLSNSSLHMRFFFIILGGGVSLLADGFYEWDVGFIHTRVCYNNSV